jgi:hypothetical protein
MKLLRRSIWESVILLPAGIFQFVGLGMRALFWAALLAAGIATEASAQVAFGPIAITNNVNGIPITVSATSWITVNASDSERPVDARIFADLIDLQRKFPKLLETLGLSTANCDVRHTDSRNPVVSLKSGSLWPVDDQLMMSVQGHVDLWSCRARPAKSEVAWRRKKIGFIKLKLPVLHTVRSMTKKKMDGTQQFRGNLPIQLVNKGGANVALKIASPEIKLEGQDTIVTNVNLDHAKLDMNQKAYAALRSAINIAKLRTILPKEYQKLTVVSTRFRSYGGHAIAEINLAAAATPTTQ